MHVAEGEESIVPGRSLCPPDRTDTEEEKEEERQGYLAQLKKKRQGKHNTHLSLPIPPDLLFPKLQLRKMMKVKLFWSKSVPLETTVNLLGKRKLFRRKKREKKNTIN